MDITEFALGLQRDFELRDDLQLVSLYNPVLNTTTPNIKAVNLELGWRELAIGPPLGVQPTDQNWRIGCLSLNTLVPQTGDHIISADNTRWTIVAVTQFSFGDTPIYHNAFGRKQ